MAGAEETESNDRFLMDHQYLANTGWEDPPIHTMMEMTYHTMESETAPSTALTEWNRLQAASLSDIPSLSLVECDVRMNEDIANGTSSPFCSALAPKSNHKTATSFARTDVENKYKLLKASVAVASTQTRRTSSNKWSESARVADTFNKSAFPRKVPSHSWVAGHCSLPDQSTSRSTGQPFKSQLANGEADPKKQRRREQNRRAARRCRERRKIREVTITQELQREMMTMQYLESQLQFLTSQKQDLEMTLTQHGLDPGARTDWQGCLAAEPSIVEVTAM